MALSLSSPLSVLKGVGKERLLSFDRAGIRTTGDLLLHFPRHYQSGTVFPLSSERVGLPSFFSLTVDTAPGVYTLPGGRRTLSFTASDEAGTKVRILYWNQPYLKRQIFQGDHAFYFGTLREKSGVFYLFSPQRETKRPEPGLLRPIYPPVGNVSSKVIEKLVEQILVPCLAEIPETLPDYLTEQFHLLSRREAIFTLHAPSNAAAVLRAKERFTFEGLFAFSVQATLFSEKTEKSRVPAFSQRDLSDFTATLPFTPTAAQKRVMEEIAGDLCGNGQIPPMNRLLQGDVGSGKTVVAAAAAYLAAKNGKSTLLMAPTEILARQHFETFKKTFLSLGIPVLLLTGSSTKKEREAIFRVTTGKEPYLLIGTHALTEESARCENVSLAITDEQHRFGVRQRTLLGEKGGAVHSLVMSATPIPRSLAMFLHARKNISILDELPPGRMPVETLYVGDDKMPRIYAFLQEEIAKGQKAYVVCPLIEDEDEKSELQSAREEWEEVSRALPRIPCALLHGKMKNEEKQRVMREFREGDTKILVSTTVIEVGVDVPEATVMVIRDAERFGLSQLHQLRGRVGRGNEKSYCVLVSSHSGKAARERLKFLCDCHDGFALAEYDLKTRGPGEFFGTRQSGFSSLPDGNVSLEQLQQAAKAAAIFLERATPEEIRPFEKKLGFH